MNNNSHLWSPEDEISCFFLEIVGLYNNIIISLFANTDSYSQR